MAGLCSNVFFALQQMVNVQDYRLFDNFSMTKSNLCYNIDLLTYDCIIAGLLNLFICWFVHLLMEIEL